MINERSLAFPTAQRMGKNFLQNMLLLAMLLQMAIIINNGQAHSSDDDQWTLRMVHNIRWDLSKSYLAVHTEDTHGKEHLGEEVMPGYEGTKMSFFYGLDFNNMLINFKTHKDTGAGYCEIGVIPDKAIKDMTEAFAQTAEYKEKHCTFQREKIYKNDGEVVNKKKYTAFCPIASNKEELVKMVIANGTFNQPAKSPQCLYDFHTAARGESFEYDLFRYCAKGYFFNGKDYNDPARIPEFRKNWLLYLAEGKVACGISGNAEEGKSLLAKGYTVELVQRFDFEQFNARNGMQACPDLEAILTSYHDKDAEGRFFFGAVVGPGQLDGHFQWSDRPNDEKRFWSEEAYKEEYRTMSLGERGCYLHYHNWNRMPNGNRFYLELRITHYCTGRAMRETINFDVSINRENAPEGFHEDRGLVIDLSAKMLRRTTAQILCAKEMPISKDDHSSPMPCVPPPRRPLERKNIGDVCDQKQSQCPLGSKCTVPENAATLGAPCANMNETCTNRGYLECGACVCRKNQETECGNDLQCADHKYCADQSQCKQMHYKESGEPCYSYPECFPGFACYREGKGDEKFGICSAEKLNHYKCPEQGITDHCEVFICPREQKWSECVIKSKSGVQAGCAKKTYDMQEQYGPYPGGLEDCGYKGFLRRLRCCL